MSPINLKGDLTPLIESSNKILKPISEGLAGIFAFVFQKPRQYNITSEIELEELAKSTRNKYNEIPYANQTLANMRQIGKILDDSIYQLDKEQFREYYAGLIASSCDNRKCVKPFYSSLIREMSTEEADLFEYFSKYTFLFEIQITSSNHLFSNPDLYRWYWPKRYFKAKIKENFTVFRNYDRQSLEENSTPLEDIYKYDEAYSESLGIESAILFLLSKKLIQENPAYTCHQFIPSIKKFVFDTDEQAQQLVRENKFSTPKVKFNVKHKVYTLTPTGEELKDALSL
ncbi:Abi-alpha family protein [Streptococcus chenjunshii]|uniref:Abi-alpha family protein n=1 Tax=Streptococcus chenjunshii TaxID=2173853 RepID=UPI0013C34FE1|nr:Abi-alpha family protein [Streptococcus chenjunshii]